MKQAALELQRTQARWRKFLRKYDDFPLPKHADQAGRFRKGCRVGGCGNPRCFVCHGDKLSGLPTRSEKRAISQAREEARELGLAGMIRRQRRRAP